VLRNLHATSSTARVFDAVSMLPHRWRALREFVACATNPDYARLLARDNCERLLPPLRRRLTATFGDSLATCTLVDFGCGYDYPLVCLLAPFVERIIGIDIGAIHQPHLRPAATLRPKTFARRLVDHDRATRMHQHLATLVGLPRDGRPYEAMTCRGDELPFPDRSVDAIVSNAVLQELPLPLEDFAREMARVLKPRGYIDLEWHNFYSISGNYGDQAVRRTDPWGHLLGHRRVHPVLNRVRPEVVTEAFAPWFADLRVIGHDERHRVAGEDQGYAPEGESLLTPALYERLHDYPRSLLLTRGYFLVGFKREPPE
jgi:SAM-dependent methyltransferase